MKWTDKQIKEYFDTHWDITLRGLAFMAGRSVEDVKKVLMKK